MGQQHAIHKFVLGTKDFDDKQSEFMYDKGWYSITDIIGEEKNIIYKSRNAQEAYLKWNIYIGRKKERLTPEERKKQREERYEKKQFYRDAEFFLHVLKEQCSNREQAGEKEILACMAEISDFCRNHLETSRTEYSRQYALKKRMDLFEQIRKNNSYALAGLRNGMSLSCNSHQDFEKEIPYLFPELYFRDQFGVFLYHLGITMENVKVSSVYALPLFEEQDVEGIGTVYRCVFMVGELTVLIENLSSDMGGLIRARDYVRLPPTARENTIMIMLMNDREELADGSYLKEGTLYNPGV